ncbi:HPF/RaiA family ribosome-associated protein [Sphingomonas sinipercae]|uniref:Ribosome hibernation promoting factor n=1 Tax=Sphingomonas sinipercae TaxID=2714944 RepID=A0A6G7ZKU6_9SPHN|nr:HPF/RaiA family ribosome-associated protein [Sphingomonas sinipercae]QIL01552.1 HPF/RaiA family ribosome-associated protein [Sphingomonas sinipercae]
MDVHVADHQVETGDSLKEQAIARVEEMTEKYAARSVGANVTFGKGPQNDFTCDIVAPVAQGVVLKAAHRAPTAEIAFQGAGDKIEKQLRRYARRLKEHRSNGAAPPMVDSNAGYTVFAGSGDEQEAPDNPTIVAETRVDIPRSSVADAVMLMDLRNTTALMFRNSNSGEFNLVYRRDDGNIGWVEPQG